ncbi:uncharacterized protein LOC124133516 isoform X2 [Haliotis rufescens]|nr:uncharacterized protein LOC124133516 isoform X2 [Haliotis rufescens]
MHVPYQRGMSLGRIYDLRTFSLGLDIFTDGAKPQTVESHQNTIRYSVIQKSADVRNVLDVSRYISLNVKAGILTLDGIWSYLREDRSQVNTLDILVAVHVETLTTILTEKEKKPGLNENQMGTHYISSLTYGGDMIVRIRIVGSDSRHFEEIKATVDARLSEWGIVDMATRNNFKRLEEDLKSNSRIEMAYYSNEINMKKPTNVSGMLDALDNFKGEVMKLNGGKGVPVMCELVALSVLDPQLPQVLKDKSLDVQLSRLEYQYDDVLQARMRLHRLVDGINYTSLNNQQEQKLLQLQDRIDGVITVFNDVISKFDVTKSEGSSQTKQSFDMYEENRRLGNFMQEVVALEQQLSLQNGTSTAFKDLPQGSRLDLVLIGKKGHGKSATANSILGQDLFLSKMSSNLVTTKCQKECGVVGGREICLIDTPGIMDTSVNEDTLEETLQEIASAIPKSSDGVHAFLLVLSIQARMTPEEYMTIHMLKKLFGEHVLMSHTIVVFTHADSFYRNHGKSGLKIDDYINEQNGSLVKLLSECNKRYVLFDNTESDKGKLRNEVAELTVIIDQLNIGQKYTNDLLETAAQIREEEKAKDKMRIEKDTEEEIERIVAERLAQKAKEEAYSCFPGGATLILEDGQTIKMKNVRVGDRVLSLTDNGKIDYSEVYLIIHSDEYRMNNYINISTTKHHIQSSHDHHVYLVSGGTKHTVPAAQVKLADRVLIYNHEKTLFEEEVVTGLSTSTEIGAFAPFTMSGTIVVNGVLASCYVDCVPPRWAHPLLWPVRQLYSLSSQYQPGSTPLAKTASPSGSTGTWTMSSLNSTTRNKSARSSFRLKYTHTFDESIYFAS